MPKDNWGRIRITQIDYEGPEESLVEIVRAATTNRDANQPRTMRAVNAELEREGRYPTELPPTKVAAALPPPQPTKAAAPPAATSSSSRKSGKKKSGGSSKKNSDSAHAQAARARQAQIKAIIEAKTFDDFERYNAAIGKKGIGHLDIAGLVARLAQTQFDCTDGLAASEILQILRERFSINRERKRVEEALRGSARTFFSVAPAQFHHKAKLYRPMKDCIDRVDELLGEFDSARLDTVSTGDNTAEAVN
jgi:hypothetical protein